MRFGRAAHNRLLGVVLAAGLATSPATTAAGHAGVGNADVGESAGWAAPEWAYSPDEPILDGDIEARAIGESISRDEAERRLKADRAVSHLMGVAQARWPDTFAGLWIEHEALYRVNVAFTRDATANVDELRADFPYPDDLQAVDALHSYGALRALQGRLATERSVLQQGRPAPDLPDEIRTTRGVYDLDIDVRTGKVIVRVARSTPAVRAAFARRYPGPVIVREGVSAPHTCTQADCRHAMLGGLVLEIGTGYCSSAFPAYYTADPSIRYVLSAGHCYQETGIVERFNGDEYYGAVTLSKMANEVDAERIRRDATTAWLESSKFIVQGESYPRMVNTVTSFANMPPDAYIGKTGYSTGTTRGYITSKDFAPSYIPNGRNFVTADMCSYKGDSGAAVWTGNSAYGIVSGGINLTTCRNINGTMGTAVSSLGGTTIFGALSYATSALGVTILAGLNLRPSATFTSSCWLLECSFDASASKDDDGGITSYTWDFGDGTTGTGRTPRHSYGLPGLYNVVLVTKDNNGGQTSKSSGIVVYSS